MTPADDDLEPELIDVAELAALFGVSEKAAARMPLRSVLVGGDRRWLRDEAERVAAGAGIRVRRSS